MQTQISSGKAWFQILKSVGIALIVASLSVAAVSATLLYFGVNERTVYAVNQGIKVISILLGCLCGLREEKGFLKGLGVGLLFTALSYLAFSCIGGDFSCAWVLIVEVFIGAAAGALGGAIAVNLKGI